MHLRLLDWSMKAASPCPVLDHGVQVSKGHHRGVMSHLIRIQWSHFHTQRSPTLSTPSQSVTDSLLITQHLNPSLCDIDETWQSWPLHSRWTDSRVKQSSLLTQLFKQHHTMTQTPSVWQPHSKTTNNQGSYLWKYRNLERSALLAFQKVRSDLLLIKWDGLVS